jgi:hypothetical protein
MHGRSSSRNFKHVTYLIHSVTCRIFEIAMRIAHVAWASVESPESMRQSPSNARARVLSGCLDAMLRSEEMAPSMLPLARSF